VESDVEKNKRETIEKWKIEGPRRDAARNKRALLEIDPEDEEFKRHAQELKAKLEVNKAPAMPLLTAEEAQTIFINQNQVVRNSSELDSINGSAAASTPDGTGQSNKCKSLRPHQDHFASKGFVSEDWHDFVHTPVPIPKAFKIPDSQKALQTAWQQLELKVAWDVTKVRPRAEVVADSVRTGREVHSGELMDLCHLKDSQMSQAFWKYKGRIVFRRLIV